MGKFNWGSALAGAGVGALSSFMPSVQPYSAALSAGAGALANRSNPVQGALTGFAGGGLGSALAGGARGFFNNTTAGNSGNAFLSGLGSGAKGYVGSIPGFGGFGTSSPTGALAKFFSGSGASPAATTGSSAFKLNTPTVEAFSGSTAPAGTGAVSAANPFANLGASSTGTSPFSSGSTASMLPTAPAPSGASGTIPTQSATKNVFDWSKMGGVLPGAATSLIGGFMVPSTKMPSFASLPNVSAYQQAASSGVANSDAYNMGVDQIKSFLNQDPTVSQETQDALLRQSIQDQNRMISQENRDINAGQWGANVANNTAYGNYVTNRDARFSQDLAAQRLANQYQFSTLQNQQKMTAMASALGINTQQMQNLQNLANMDVNQVMVDTTLSAAEREQKIQAIQQAAQIMSRLSGANNITLSMPTFSA